MDVEIRAEAALFPEKEYINGIAVAVHGSFIPVCPKTIIPLFLTMVKMSPNFPETFLNKDTKSSRKLYLTL